MDIVLYQWEDKNYDRFDRLDINNKKSLQVGPLYECPEDAVIGRDLVSCSDVLGFIEEAYEAGKRGEKLTITLYKKDPDNANISSIS